MKFVVFFTVMALAGSAFANDDLLTRDELTPEVFPASAERIRSLMNPGEVHGNLAESQKTQVERHLERAQQQLDQPARTERGQELALERNLRNINKILATSRTSPSSQSFCRRERRTGSNFVEVVCYDRDELEAKRNETRDSFFRPEQCVGDVCTSAGSRGG